MRSFCPDVCGLVKCYIMSALLSGLSFLPELNSCCCCVYYSIMNTVEWRVLLQ